MRLVLGIPGCWASSGGGRVWPVLSWRARISLDRSHIQTLMYLKLSVAGHLDDFPDAHARPVLVHTPGADSMGSGAWHTDGGDA